MYCNTALSLAITCSMYYDILQAQQLVSGSVFSQDIIWVILLCFPLKYIHMCYKLSGKIIKVVDNYWTFTQEISVINDIANCEK